MTVSDDLGRLRTVLRDETNATKLLDAMTLLEQIPVTISLLKSTKIGKTLARVARDGEEEALRNRANALLLVWKETASAEKTTKKDKSKTPSSTAGSSSTTTKPTTRPQSIPMSKIMPATMPTDAVRAKVCKLLLGVFKGDAELTDNGRDQMLAVGIENAIFLSNGHDPKSTGYREKFRMLHFNLPKNSALRVDLAMGHVQLDKLVQMSSQELLDAEAQKVRLEQEDAAFQRSRGDWFEANRDKLNAAAGVKETGGLFKCGRCKSTKTTHYQKQTRSADEPMTVFVQCTNCSNRWRC